MAKSEGKITTTARDFIKSLPLTPHVITGYLLNFAIWKFSDVDNIVDPKLRKAYYLWDEEDTIQEIRQTGINITTAHRFDPTLADQVPAIVIARGGCSQGPRMSIGDRRHVPTSLLGQANANEFPTLGHNSYHFLLGGRHIIYCVNRTGAGAEVLGIEMWHALLDYSQVIRADLKADEFRVGELGAAGKIQEFNDNWTVPIQISYKYQRKTMLTSESPILKGFDFKANNNT